MACVLSQRLTMCQNYFCFSYTRYIYDEAFIPDFYCSHKITKYTPCYRWFLDENEAVEMQENHILSLSSIGLSTVLCVRSRWASSKAFIIISLNWQNNDSLLPSVQIVAQSGENSRVAGHSLVFNSCQHTPLKGPMVSFEGKEGRINVSTGWLTIPVLPPNLWTRFLQPYHSANVLRDSQTPLAISKCIIATNRAMSTRLEKLLSDLFVPLSTLTTRV